MVGDRLLAVLEKRLVDDQTLENQAHVSDEPTAGRQTIAFGAVSQGTSEPTDDQSPSVPHDDRNNRANLASDLETAVDQSGLDTDAPRLDGPYSLELPLEVADALVHLYFTKVQMWLPLFHKPRFFAKFMTGPGDMLLTTSGYALEDALIFYGMFALAARYASHSYFEMSPPRTRNIPFSKKAQQLYGAARTHIDTFTLSYLQGCVLLAFDGYSAGPNPRSWILTGVCVRMAYELGLDRVERYEPTASISAEGWAHNQELIRTWWLVWELDTFGSMMLERPFAIDRRRMNTPLPVSDAAYFANTPVQSAPLMTRPADTWKSLRECANQCERAWFLISIHLLASVYDLTQGGFRETDCEELLDAITCFGFSIPDSVYLENNPTPFSNETVARENWIICTHIMVTKARAGLIELESHSPVIDQSCTLAGRQVVEAARMEREIARIVHRWSPEHIPLCHPFVPCTLISASTGARVTNVVIAHAVAACAKLWTLAHELTSKYRRHWHLLTGLCLLCIAIGELLAKVNDQDHVLLPHEVQLAKRYAILFSRSTAKTIRTLSDQDRQSACAVAVWSLPMTTIEESANASGAATNTNGAIPRASDVDHPAETPIITSELLACPSAMNEFDLGFAGDWPSEIDVGSGMEFF